MKAIGKGIYDQIGCQCDFKHIYQHEGEGGEGECQASSKLYIGITKLWEEVVCPKGLFNEWHQKECLLGECLLCGVETLEFCPCETNVNIVAFMQWQQYVMIVVGKDKVGNKSKRLKLEYMETIPNIFINYFKPKLVAFIEHNFFARWQDIQFKSLLATIPKDVVSIIDFAKNYGFKVQNEVQFMHWHTTHVSILVHITYRWSMPLGDDIIQD
jgi:hypothetical protein